jgi:sialidase-1
MNYNGGTVMLKRSLTQSLAVALILSALVSQMPETASAQDYEIISSSVICKETHRYIGWPTIAKTSDGELLAVFSGDRDAHVCPWGKTELIRSSDNGKTWSEPVIINNTPLDDRDAGVMVTSTGTVIVSWFTSLAFTDERYIGDYPQDMVSGWLRHAEKLTPELKEEWLGCWIRRSEDNGLTWGEHIQIPGNSPHGPVEISDGRLLYVGKMLWADERKLIAMESVDDGRSWRTIGEIPVIPGESIDHYHELHAVETASATLLAMIRYNPSERDNAIMRQSESHDGGKTWSVPRPTGIWGYPPHLMKLSDGRLMVTYGYRREPFGERACISTDNGNTWNLESPIGIAPALNHDLGYPASVELADGSIYTVYYQQENDGEPTCLMGTHWRLK